MSLFRFLLAPAFIVPGHPTRPLPCRPDVAHGRMQTMILKMAYLSFRPCNPESNCRRSVFFSEHTCKDWPTHPSAEKP